MEQKLTINHNKKPCYDIVYYYDFLQIKDQLEQLPNTYKKVCIITDHNVEALYGALIKEQFEKYGAQVSLYSFLPGEESKTLETVKSVYSFLIEHHIERKDLLVALGGGVVGDLCGFVAATYLRGMDYIQMPTTLLSQVDSSIGGKTGVDFDGYKNMIGAFKMPQLVYMNLSTLLDLDDRQFFSGMAEVMKHGLIKNASYYEWLITNFYEIGQKEKEILAEMVYESNKIKKAIVEKDPTEQGERALLNLGHTIGHALEKHSNFKLLHGECVALGTVAAAFISWKKEFLSMDEYYEIRDMFVPFELPISITDINCEEILTLTKSDKKMEDGIVKFILLKKIGKAVVNTFVTNEEILQGIQEILFKEFED